MLIKVRFFRHAIFQLDNTGHDLKMVNLYGNGLIGRVDVNWVEVIYDDEVGNTQIDWKRHDRRNYYIKDHLGSIRVVVDQYGQVTSAQDYYPFGETLRTYTVGSGQNDKYKFTEKERDIETGYDYFGARFYDSRIGRWLSVDPLTEMYPGWCPYNYCMNNPLKFIDPDGKAPGDLTAKKRAFYGGVGASIVRVAESHGIKKEQALYMVSQRLQENG